MEIRFHFSRGKGVKKGVVKRKVKDNSLNTILTEHSPHQPRRDEKKSLKT